MINDPKIQLTRETFGNIPDWSVKAFYIIAIASVLIFVWGVWRRWKLWKQGKPISIRKILLGNYQRLKPRLGRLFKEGLGQKRVRGRGLASCHGRVGEALLGGRGSGGRRQGRRGGCAPGARGDGRGALFRSG